MVPKRTQRTPHSEAVNPLRRSPRKQKSQLQAPDTQKGTAASRATFRVIFLKPAAVSQVSSVPPLAQRSQGLSTAQGNRHLRPLPAPAYRQLLNPVAECSPGEARDSYLPEFTRSDFEPSEEEVGIEAEKDTNEQSEDDDELPHLHDETEMPEIQEEAKYIKYLITWHYKLWQPSALIRHQKGC